MSVCPPIVPFPTLHYPIPLLPPLMCSSVTLSFTYSVPLVSSVTMSFITSVYYVIMASASFCLSFWLLSFMSLWLLHHSVCHYDFCPLCHYGFCIILSVIITSVLYVITSSASFCLSFWLLSLMSLRLLFPCYFVFYILCPLCLPFILSGLEGLLCKLFLRTY